MHQCSGVSPNTGAFCLSVSAAFQKVTEFVGRSDNYHRYKLIEREKARSVRREKIHSDISQQLRMKSKIENQNALLELEYKVLFTTAFHWMLIVDDMICSRYIYIYWYIYLSLDAYC